MVQTCQVICSTQKNHKEAINAQLTVDNMNPPEQICSALDDKMFCFAVLTDANEGTIYKNLTGRFPVCLYAGMKCIFVVYIYKIYANLMHPMPSRTDTCMITAFKDIYE